MYDRVTQEDIDKWKAEIEQRKNVDRPKLLEEVKEAKAQGDLSENFEYYAAKKAHRENESRILYLEKLIKTARLVEGEAKADVAGLGKKVTVFIVDDEEEETYELVTSVRQNALENLISIESPVGKALLGCKEGDMAHVVTETGYEYDMKVLSVE
jgi:transcription elongation factor GreA